MYAAERVWQFPELACWSDYAVVHQAWLRSARTHASIRECLRSGALPESIRSVAVSGSLGRMEQLPQSDCDIIVVVADESLEEGPQRAAVLQQSVWDALRPLQIPAPLPDGIFAQPTSVGQLCDPARRGRIEEEPAVFGKRIQLLLDTQPVYGSEAYRDCVTSILDWYTGSPADGSSDWTYMQNDLIRYYRSLCVACQWGDRDNPARRWERNAKLRHSRLISYAALLLLSVEASLLRQPSDWLMAQLTLTPLERLAAVYQRARQPGFARIMEAYDQFLGCLESRVFSQVDAQVGALAEHPTYRLLEDGGREIAAELTRLLLSQSAENDRLVQELIF